MKLKYWPTLITGALCLTVLDMIIRVETDPWFILYIHYFAWFAFGQMMGETHKNDTAGKNR